MTISKDTTLTGSLKSADGTLQVPYTAEVLKSYINVPSHALRLKLTIEGGDSVVVTNDTVQGKNADLNPAQEIIDKVKVCSCQRCKKPAFDPATCVTNRNGYCNACFMADLKAEWNELQEKERLELERNDDMYREQGYTHRVQAWIHPKHGSDFKVSFWMVNPTEKAIKAVLRKEGSAVLDDYSVHKL